MAETDKKSSDAATDPNAPAAYNRWRLRVLLLNLLLLTVAVAYSVCAARYGNAPGGSADTRYLFVLLGLAALVQCVNVRLWFRVRKDETRRMFLIICAIIGLVSVFLAIHFSGGA